jgi:hypothetical protein
MQRSNVNAGDMIEPGTVPLVFGQSIRCEISLGSQIMRLYGAIQKVEPQDDGTVRVHGIATSEAVDEQGEIVRADAIRAAIPDYMRFPALREMHQLSAAGTTLEAEVCDDGTTRIVAHVVDPVAVAKVRNHVYRGFSIGGRVTQRDAGDPRSITGLVLNEISLVDRPANPEAIFDCWKAVVAADGPLAVSELRGLADTTQAELAPGPFNAPIQVWACAVPNHRHLAKADALKCLKSSGLEAGCPSKVPNAIAATDENPAGLKVGKSAPESNRGNTEKVKHSRADQALLDMAHFACDQCLKIGGLSVEEQTNMDRSRHHLLEAGAMAIPSSTPEEVEGGDPSSPTPEQCSMGDGAEIGMMKVLGMTEVLCKRQRAHENLTDMAHACLKALTDGQVCDQAAKLGARHSAETMEHFNASHGHLVAAGAGCDMAGLDEPRPTTKLATGAHIRAADLAVAARDERHDNSALAKVLGEIVPMLERLAKRVDEIARTPLPPLTMAKGMVSVSKEQDRGDNSGGADPEPSPAAIAAALAKMSKEEQTLTLIKASYASPIPIAGSAADHR